jgi:rSAM/selenodomain-associated transferase 1
LGKEAAVQIHKQLVSHCIKTLEKFIMRERGTTYHIYHHGASEELMQKWLGTHCFATQQGKDLGERMANALIDNLQTAEKCVLIGSDCPDIDPPLLQEALLKLQTNDLVLGPAYDGGYYLIGINCSLARTVIKEIFSDIPWGTDKVFSASILRLEKLNIHYHLLQKLHDIDVPDDLNYFHHHSNAQ